MNSFVALTVCLAFACWSCPPLHAGLTPQKGMGGFEELQVAKPLEKKQEEQQGRLGVSGEETKSTGGETAPELRLQAEKPIKQKYYVVYGVVRLLFDNVTEPFSLYYDGEKKRSRVDYGEDGKVKTLQFGGDVNKRYRIDYPIVPTMRPVCIEMKGSLHEPVEAQRAIPLLDNFDYAGSDRLGNVDCNRWKFNVPNEHRSKEHEFLLFTEQKTHKPLRLQVISRNTKTGHVLDRYEVDYNKFYVAQPPDDVFQLPPEIHCRSIMGTDVQRQSGRPKRRVGFGENKPQEQEEQRRPEQTDERELLFMNPIANFVDPVEHMKTEQQIERLFSEYKHIYNKKYESEEEQEIRKTAFCHNVRFIRMINRAGRTYKLAVNHLADRTNEELGKMLGIRRSQQMNMSGSQRFDYQKHNVRGIGQMPSSIDWRYLGAVSPVLDQKDCGSDWAIAAKSVVESALFLRTNRPFKLSTQELLDCSHTEGNQDCKSGEEVNAYEYIRKNGLASTTRYGLLHNRKAECRRHSPVSTKIKHWVLVPDNEEELKQAIALNGPVVVRMDASHKSFFFYSYGIYKEPQCQSDRKGANHAVVFVGYDQMKGRDIFLIKNSFGTDWGQGGYMLIDSSNNQCGILNTPTFVTIE